MKNDYMKKAFKNLFSYSTKLIIVIKKALEQKAL